MTGYLLDTNIVSELRKRSRADVALLSWLDGNRAEEFWLSVLVVGELRRGVELIRRRDVVSAVVLAEWLDSVVADYGDRILPVTGGICEQWARITVPDPLPMIDGLLAATAIEHDLVLVTRNVAGVDSTPVRVIDPFAS